MAADCSRAASKSCNVTDSSYRRTSWTEPHITRIFKWRVGLIPEPREALWLSNPLLALCVGPGPMVPQTPPPHYGNDDILPLPSPAQP